MFAFFYRSVLHYPRGLKCLNHDLIAWRYFELVTVPTNLSLKEIT